MKIGEYEQMMAYLTRPRFKDGTIPKQKPFTKEEFEKRADGLVQGSFGGMRRNIEGVKLLKDTMDELISKALDSGAIKSRKEAVDFILQREKYYSNFIESEKSKGVEVPVLSRDEFSSGSLASGARQGMSFLKRKYKGSDLEAILENPKLLAAELGVEGASELLRLLGMFSEGGMVGKKSGPPPESGPMSQGLNLKDNTDKS